MSLKALITEDEDLSWKLFARLLRGMGVDVVAEASDGHQAADLLRQTNVDIAFLDIDMPEGEGVEVVQAVRDGHAPCVVFLAARGGHEADTPPLRSVDLLLKSLDEPRLAGTLDRVHATQTIDSPAVLDTWRERLERVMVDIRNNGNGRPKPYAERLLLKEESALQFVRVDDIECIEADGNHVRIRTAEGTHTVRRQLGQLEAQLNPGQFIRIHRSTIVNVDAVDHLEPWFSGGYLVRLKSGRDLKLSRGYANRLFGRIGTTL